MGHGRPRWPLFVESVNHLLILTRSVGGTPAGVAGLFSVETFAARRCGCSRRRLFRDPRRAFSFRIELN